MKCLVLSKLVQHFANDLCFNYISALINRRTFKFVNYTELYSFGHDNIVNAVSELASMKANIYYI